MNVNDKGLIRSLFVAPSWKLARDKQLESGCRVSVWARALSDDPEKTQFIREKYNCLIVDEVSMMSEGQKELFLKNYGDMKLIFCGDVGFQLPCISGEPITEEGFDNMFIMIQIIDARIIS